LKNLENDMQKPQGRTSIPTPVHQVAAVAATTPNLCSNQTMRTTWLNLFNQTLANQASPRLTLLIKTRTKQIQPNPTNTPSSL